MGCEVRKFDTVCASVLCDSLVCGGAHVAARRRSGARSLKSGLWLWLVRRMLEETLYHWSPAASGSSVDVDVDAHSSESGPKARRRLDLKVQSADDAGMGAQERQQAIARPLPVNFARNWKHLDQRSPRSPRTPRGLRRASCGSPCSPCGSPCRPPGGKSTPVQSPQCQGMRSPRHIGRAESPAAPPLLARIADELAPIPRTNTDVRLL
jgi:hypothetical protein